VVRIPVLTAKIAEITFLSTLYEHQWAGSDETGRKWIQSRAQAGRVEQLGRRHLDERASWPSGILRPRASANGKEREGRGSGLLVHLKKGSHVSLP